MSTLASFSVCRISSGQALILIMFTVEPVSINILMGIGEFSINISNIHGASFRVLTTNIASWMSSYSLAVTDVILFPVPFSCFPRSFAPFICCGTLTTDKSSLNSVDFDLLASRWLFADLQGSVSLHQISESVVLGWFAVVENRENFDLWLVRWFAGVKNFWFYFVAYLFDSEN